MTKGMQALRACTALAAVVLSWIAGPAEARERRLLELQTRDFTIYSAAGEKQTRYFASNMAAFDRIVAGTAGVSLRRSAGPTRIFLLSQADWQDYFQPRAEVGGYFSDTSGVANDLVMPVSNDRAASYRVIFHEYTHFILRTQFPGYVPPWFNEGLAELLGTAQFFDGRIELPAPQDRLYTLNNSPWIHSSALFGVTENSPEYRAHTLAPSFYAQSWLVMSYAFVGNPPFLRQVVEYVLRLNRGETQEVAAQAAFHRDFEQIDRELRDYASHRAFRNGQIASSTERGPASAPIRTLSPTESARVLAELGLRGFGRFERLESLLAGTASTDAVALATKANLLAIADKPKEADEILAMAALSSPQEPDAWTYIGDTQITLAWPRPANQQENASAELLDRLKPVNADPARLRLARTAYQKALAAEPTSAAAAHGLVQVCIELKDCIDAAAAGLAQAQAAAPVSWMLAYDAALLAEAKGDAAAARTQWRSVAHLARSSRLRDEALSRVKE